MFRKLLSLEEAKSKIIEALSPKPLGIEVVPLLKAVGRVIAEDIASPINVPQFNRSTVDGYALRAENTFEAEEDAPVNLKLMGRVDVGEMPDLHVKKGGAVEITTGAPLPTGTDAVVMIENTAEKGEIIFIYKPVVKGENVMMAGSDIKENETVLKRGKTLFSRELGVLAALGFNEVKVFRQPRVAIVSTGKEIVEPGKVLPPGKIFDINTYTLTASVHECGGKPIGFGVVKGDNSVIFRKTLKKTLDTADIVVTSGGVSVGPMDIVPETINKLGKPGLIVHGVAIKPGKPVAVAIVDGKPIFSLPGNPTSSLLTFHLLVRPILFRVAGKEEKTLLTLRASIMEKLFAARGRRTFVPVTLSCDNKGQWLASPVPPGQSGAITTLAKADGYVELMESQQFIDIGEEVTVFLFKPVWD